MENYLAGNYPLGFWPKEYKVDQREIFTIEDSSSWALWRCPVSSKIYWRNSWDFLHYEVSEEKAQLIVKKHGAFQEGTNSKPMPSVLREIYNQDYYA